MAWPFGILGSPCFSPSGTWPYKEKGLKFVKSKTGGVLDQFHTQKSYDFLFALSLSTFHLEFTVVENHFVCLIIMKTFRFIRNFFKDVSDETKKNSLILPIFFLHFLCTYKKKMRVI